MKAEALSGAGRGEGSKWSIFRGREHDLRVLARILRPGVIANLIGIISILAGLAQLIAIATGLDQQIPPLIGRMRPIAAIGFILAGTSLSLADSQRRLATKLGIACAWTLVFAGILIAVDWQLDAYFNGSPSPYFDRLFGGHEDHISPAAAILFALIGFALLACSHRKTTVAFANIVSVGLAISGVIVCNVYLEGREAFSNIQLGEQGLASIALAIFLCVGILLAGRKTETLSETISPVPGTLAARRLLPTVIIAMVVLTVLEGLARREHLLSPSVSTVVFEGTSITIVAVLVWLHLRALNRTEGEVRAAKEAAQIAILEERLQFEKIIASATDAILICDPENRIVLFNMAAEKMLGFPATSAIGRDIHQFLLNLPSVSTGSSSLQQHDSSATLVQCRHASGAIISAEVSISQTVTNQRTFRTCILRDITEHLRSERILTDLNQQLRTLALRLQTVREEERTGLAREIHDVLAQDLTRLKIDAVWCRKKLADSATGDHQFDIVHRLEAVTTEIDEAITTVQKIATELRPALLDHFGLPAAIEWEGQEFTRRTGIPCHTIVPSQSPPATPEQATALFRILQESLTNIIRHAEAKSVKVSLSSSHDHINLCITDDGRGISSEHFSDPRSIGLLGMRERATALDGTVEISTRPQGGTIITARLPIPHDIP